MIELTDVQTTLRAKRGIEMPVVLTIEEIQELFKNTNGIYLLYLQLLYGSGLIISELVNLRIKDFNFTYNTITVRSSKGDKDRIRRHISSPKLVWVTSCVPRMFPIYG